MRRSLVLLALTLTVPTLAGKRQPVVAVLPVQATSPDLLRLSSLLEAQVGALLLASGRVTTLDMKQVLAMAGQEGLDPQRLAEDAEADQARVLIGADLVVAATLATNASGGLTLSGSVRDEKQATPFTVTVPASPSAALTQGSEAMARAVFTVAQSPVPKVLQAQPDSASDEGLTSLGACWETALRQPMGIDAPVGLSGDELDAAIASCRAALTADPSLRFASATLALLLAVAREDAEAEALLGSLPASDRALTPFVLARYWLLSRNTSAEAAIGFLASVVKKAPGALLVRSLQASALGSMNEHSRAVTAWKDYLAQSPASSFARGRLSASLARQGQVDAALAFAMVGLELAPRGREARLAVAARQLDAGKLDEARATLQPLVESPKAPAEPLLQLGLAYWAAEDFASAKPLFEVASERAVGPRAWKTKGRALYQLAVLEAKAGQLGAAKTAYAASVETGYRVAEPDPLLSEVVKAFKPKTTSALTPGVTSGLYFKVAALDPEMSAVALVDEVLHEKLSSLGAVFAPVGEDPQAAATVIKARKLKGYELRVKVKPGEAEGSLKVDMLVMSYPQQALKGSWSVKASGATQEALVTAMVARLVDDAALDLEWK